MFNWFRWDTDVFIGILAVACLTIFSMPVMAEGAGNLGNKAYGANRRVQSESGYVGIEVAFLEPADFSTPSLYDQNGNYIEGSNRYSSKPTFYLGLGTVGSVIDAGIQWEFETKYGGHSGWAALISWDHAGDYDNDKKPDKYTNPKVNGNPWRVPRGGLGIADIQCEATSTGGAKLTISTFTDLAEVLLGPPHQHFSFYWSKTGYNDGSTTGAPVFPVDANNHITDSAANAMYAKKVIGITQVGEATCDGSYMNNAGGTTLQLAKSHFDDQNDFSPQWSPGVKLSDIDQSETKYAPGNKADELGRWIIDFDFDGMTIPSVRGPADTNDPQGTYRNNVVENRYNLEAVHVHLQRKPSRLAGLQVGELE